jgi:hypothetical protein
MSKVSKVANVESMALDYTDSTEEIILPGSLGQIGKNIVLVAFINSSL